MTRTALSKLPSIKKHGPGRELRTLLNLRSTNFTWEPTATGITIKTVWIRAWGRDESVRGKRDGTGRITAEHILSHYYPSTTLKSINYCKK